MATTAHVTPELLRWARESIGYSREEAAEKIRVKPEKLEAAEAGDALLTLRQAERAADVYDRPFAALFLPSPPAEEPQETQFRRLPGAPPPPWPPAMQSLARRIRQRQEAAAELYDLLEETPPWAAAQQELEGVDRGALARSIRLTLGIDFAEQSSWRDPAGFTPLRAWVGAVEGLGILVMQDGTLPLESMRGFASTHPTVPAIVVNTKDDPRARAFTVIHELGHLALAANGVPVGPETEGWCDRFAGEILMPTDRLAEVFKRAGSRDPLAQIDETALTFGVTPLAAAVRVAVAGLLSREQSDLVIERIRARVGVRRGGGGNYYRTKITRLGPAFIRLVFDAVDGQALTLSNAAGLLEVKVNHFEKLRDTVATRVEFE